MPNYTLQLFRSLLDKKPVGLPDEVQADFEAQYMELETGEVEPEILENAMIEYGKASWAYRQAEEELKETFAKEKEQELFLGLLGDELQAKWGDFVSKGGNIHDFRHGKTFEDFFTPEENTAIESAFVEVDQMMEDYLENLIEGEQSGEFQNLVTKYKKEQKEIETKIEELRAIIPQEGEKWDEEIGKVVRDFELGLAEVEERPTVEKVQGKIDLYKGQIEAGNT